MSHPQSDRVWQRADVAEAFLDERSLALPFRKEQLDVLVRLLRHASRPIERVADLGCGDGVILATILNAFPATKGIGIDFSRPMLDRAKERLAPFGNRAELMEADLGDTYWQPRLGNSLDAIVSGFAIHHLPDERKRELYTEIFAALATGGVFVNCEHVASPTTEVEALFDEANAEHLFNQRTSRGEDATFEHVRREYLTRPDRAANILASVETQLQWLSGIGFINVDCFWKWFELAVLGGYKP